MSGLKAFIAFMIGVIVFGILKLVSVWYGTGGGITDGIFTICGLPGRFWAFPGVQVMICILFFFVSCFVSFWTCVAMPPWSGG